MKKLIFGLMAFMLLFCVMSCDNGTKDNNPNLSPDVTPSEGNNTTTETDPYEELEKSLTVKLNSIDEVEFSDGEWEFYNEYYEKEGMDGAQKSEYKGIMTVDNGLVTLEYNYEKTILEYFLEELYLEDKEYYADREGYSFDDKNKVIFLPEDIPETKEYEYDDFIDDLNWYFKENSIEETEYGRMTETYLAKTNSKKDAFLFHMEEKYEDFEDPEDPEDSGEGYDKYIFKKVK